MNGDPGHSADFLLLVLRFTLAVVFLAHGWNHVFGGGRIPGTARWFESLGMRPGRLHAWLASITELGAGALLLLGLLTPLASAALLGTMVVALVTNHLKNGFFIFRPGEGYEYVLVLSVCAVVIGGWGAGAFSLDHALGILGGGWWQTIATAALGLGGGALLLVMFWRPDRTAVSAPAGSAAS
ncbi:DoxX family protein [Nocardioides houyundeii]|uniref:DoxX family protein n=1 Tax=Nocardioides houyundeii TaxID=2045452 RepID=UPI000DF2B9C5|nr:DoxX family protein [Nocardioides houyundeii]